MTTQKLDFDYSIDSISIADITIFKKLKQLCIAIDAINERLDKLESISHPKAYCDKKVISQPEIIDIYERLKDLEGRQRIAETLVALEDNSLLNKVGELSMQINMLKSDLREFEKQKVDPLRERLDKLEKRMDNQEKYYSHQEIKKECDHDWKYNLHSYINGYDYKSTIRRQCVKCGAIE